MLTTVFVLHFVAATMAQISQKVELSDEKTPYDYVKHRLDIMSTDTRSGLPISNSYEVEDSGDYPESIRGAASTILNTVTGVGGVGLGQTLGTGFGNFGGLGRVVGGQGIGLGGFGIGSLGGTGAGGVGLYNGVGVFNPSLGAIGGFGGFGVGNGLLYHPILGAVGGGYVDKKAYDAAQNKGAGENVEKVEKKVEEEAKHGQEGFQQAAVAAKSEKGDSSFYKDEGAKKKAVGDEKYYEGGQKLDKQGANEEQVKKAKSHKKGHVTKGFKTSSSKNEEEKSETYYDEAHDEADHRTAGHNAGSFGEKAQQGFKGAHEEKVLDANSQGKEGHHVSEHKVDDAKANKGEFLQKGYKGGAEQLEKFNNLGAHSVHGHQEATGGFQENKGILPIHS